jgi:2-dehydro-3-deoxygluconokinase
VSVDVVTLGECLVALRAQTPGPLRESATFTRHVAGAEANFAVGLARLGHGVAFIGRTGEDAFGDAVLARLAQERVELRHLVRDGAPTGLLVRESRRFGAAQVLYYRAHSAGSRLAVDDVERAGETIASARWLHLTGITPALSDSACAAAQAALEIARAAGVTVSFDVNLRRKLWSSDEEARVVLRPFVDASDVVLGGSEELVLFTGATDPESAAATLAAGGRIVVAKLGAEGALAVGQDGHVVHARGVAVLALLDPVGAGDAFAAGFVSARLDGVELAGALARGNLCGAFVVAAEGDVEGAPTRRELEDYARDTIR